MHIFELVCAFPIDWFFFASAVGNDASRPQPNRTEVPLLAAVADDSRGVERCCRALSSFAGGATAGEWKLVLESSQSRLRVSVGPVSTRLELFSA